MPAVSTQVHSRNGLGRFRKACERAATETVTDLAEQGAALSSTLAPRRTGALAGSIMVFVTSRTSAVWGSNLKYAAPQETGWVGHPLPANVKFFWEKAGRMWMTPDQYLRVTGWPGADPIWNPPHGGVHYLENSYKVIKARASAIAKKHYPG